MAKELTTIDVSHNPELLHLAAAVLATNEPRRLRRAGEVLVEVMFAEFVEKPHRKRASTWPDYEAFRAAAGGWKDVDTDWLIADIYAGRDVSDRPPVEL
ncbi:MAG TPA: hypothetical protein VNL71_03765 [Chloroflexota bacterium]|nr:hypothetical protein [Chloroflexota bacterium]